MKPLTFDKKYYFIDGKPVYLYAGEFHYFRVPKPDWRRRMQLFKEAGGNCLATYIPWLIHEPEEGESMLAIVGLMLSLFIMTLSVSVLPAESFTKNVIVTAP